MRADILWVGFICLVGAGFYFGGLAAWISTMIVTFMLILVRPR